MEFLAKGKRGRVYLTEKNTVVKKASEYQVKNEVFWLKKLNKYDIGPKLISYDKESFEIEYLKGELIKYYLEKSDKNKCLKIIRGCLKQCRILDKLKVNKKEMNHPYKHIIVIKNKAKFIDFERCKITENPKNVTQFCQYLTSKTIYLILNNRGIKIDVKDLIKSMKNYKKKQTEKNFKKIFSFFS